MAINPNFLSSILLKQALSHDDGLCPCVKCHGELSHYMMDSHSDLCCSISHSCPPASRRTDEQTLRERVISRTEEANVISMAHPSV